MTHSRYAIYYLPAPGPLATFGAEWLGWDVSAAAPATPPAALAGRPDDHVISARKYGFHATLKAPFRLAEGHSEADLRAALHQHAAALTAPRCDALALDQLGGFLALTPRGDTADLNACVAQIVERFDPYRAPLTEADLIRRRKSPLTPAQDALMLRWGYPYVMEEFRFHMTLSSRLTEPTLSETRDRLAPVVGPLCPQHFVMEDICLAAETPNGFIEIDRAPLARA